MNISDDEAISRAQLDFDNDHLSPTRVTKHIIALARISASVKNGNADDLRALGMSVAIHNDYRQNGISNTFWLLTKPDGTYLVGEGRTDTEALNKIRSALPQSEEAK